LTLGAFILMVGTLAFIAMTGKRPDAVASQPVDAARIGEIGESD
jgi:hypothetical protein